MKGDTARTDLVVKAMTIIDGKALSEKVLKEIEKEHSELEKKVGRKAGLAVIIVGENPASQIYVRNKIRACEKVGFHSETIRLDENITEENLLLEIEKLNNNSNIDGILVQLPIPKHIDGLKIINAISAEKDVDGFHTTNIGKMMIGDETGFLPCTPAGVVHMFEEYNINLEGKDVLVIGQSNIVGKPMTLLLIKKRATVQVCNSKTKNLSEKLQKADVVVAAAGSPKLVKASDVKEDVVVIDVGINRVDGKLCGDVDFEEVSKKASFITPVPGGVGPMTIAMLIKNTFKSYKQKIDVFKDTQMETINISLRAKELEEFVMVSSSKKKLIERKVDRIVFNVDQSIASQGVDAIEVLQRTPKVDISKGAIQLIGKSNLGVMILTIG